MIKRSKIWICWLILGVLFLSLVLGVQGGWHKNPGLMLTCLVGIVVSLIFMGAELFKRHSMGQPIPWDLLVKGRIYEVCGKLLYEEDRPKELVELAERDGFFSKRRIVRVPSVDVWEELYKGLQLMIEGDGSILYIYSKLPVRPHQKPQEIATAKTEPIGQ